MTQTGLSPMQVFSVLLPVFPNMVKALYKSYGHMLLSLTGARPVFRVSSNKGVPGLNVQCNGNETKITDCSRGPLMVSNDTMMGAICHTTGICKPYGQFPFGFC